MYWNTQFTISSTPCVKCRPLTAEAILFEHCLSAHTFWSLADGLNIRSSIQPAGGINMHSSTRLLATACLPEQMESTPVHPREAKATKGIRQQDLGHSRQKINRSESIAREQRDVYSERCWLTSNSDQSIILLTYSSCPILASLQRRTSLLNTHL